MKKTALIAILMSCALIPSSLRAQGLTGQVKGWFGDSEPKAPSAAAIETETKAKAAADTKTPAAVTATPSAAAEISETQEADKTDKETASDAVSVDQEPRAKTPAEYEAEVQARLDARAKATVLDLPTVDPEKDPALNMDDAANERAIKEALEARARNQAAQAQTPAEIKTETQGTTKTDNPTLLQKLGVGKDKKPAPAKSAAEAKAEAAVDADIESATGKTVDTGGVAGRELGGEASMGAAGGVDLSVGGGGVQ